MTLIVTSKLKVGQRIVLNIESQRPGVITSAEVVNESWYGYPLDTWRIEYKVRWDDEPDGKPQTMFHPTIIAAQEEV